MIAKLAIFAIERAAEPISERLERNAQRSPRFRHACHQLANWVQNLDYHRKQRRSNFMATAAWEDTPGRAPPSAAAPEEIEPPEPLAEDEATQRGCEILGEGFVLSVGLALLLHQRQAENEQEEADARRVEANETKIADLVKECAKLSEQCTALSEQVARLNEQVLSRPACSNSGSGPRPNLGTWFTK